MKPSSAIKLPSGIAEALFTDLSILHHLRKNSKTLKVGHEISLFEKLYEVVSYR